MRSTNDVPAKHGMPWSKEDVNVLSGNWGMGNITLIDVARYLERSTWACECKAESLKLGPWCTEGSCTAPPHPTVLPSAIPTPMGDAWNPQSLSYNNIEEVSMGNAAKIFDTVSYDLVMGKRVDQMSEVDLTNSLKDVKVAREALKDCKDAADYVKARRAEFDKAALSIITALNALV